jgi:hypothetical protein
MDRKQAYQKDENVKGRAAGDAGEHPGRHNAAPFQRSGGSHTLLRFKLNSTVTLPVANLLYDVVTMRRNYATAVADAVIWSSSLLLAAVLLFVMLNATHHWIR